MVLSGHCFQWLQITFKPDLARFGMEVLDDDIIDLMRRRVYDMAGVLGKQIKVRHMSSPPKLRITGAIWRAADSCVLGRLRDLH